MLLGGISILMYGVYSKSAIKDAISYQMLFYIFILSFVGFYCTDPEVSYLAYGFLSYSDFSIRMVCVLLAACTLFVLYLLCLRSWLKYIGYEFGVIFLLSVIGMISLIGSSNVLGFYVSLELISLPLYVLASSDMKRIISSEAALKYFILGSLASCLLLFGASIIYGFAGSLDFAKIAAAQNSTGLMIGCMIFFVALCFKISAAPFHIWVPDIYYGVPTIVTLLFSTIPKFAFIIVFIGFFESVFVKCVEHYHGIVIILSLASIFIGSFGALMQENFKRMLVYSSISHVGFALLALLDVATAHYAALYFLFYLFMSFGAFACLFYLGNSSGKYKDDLLDLSGLSSRHPYLSFSISVFMLSMAGIPPLAGFFAKVYIVMPAIQMGFSYIALIAVLMTVISAFYYLRVIKVIYFGDGNVSYTASPGGVFFLLLCLLVSFNLLYVFAPSLLTCVVFSAVR